MTVFGILIACDEEMIHVDDQCGCEGTVVWEAGVRLSLTAR